jgi:D-beta-D-heptose 7-phosphate kinase/D-beta-D-heptose 1-phosphate adenosyltransferase
MSLVYQDKELHLPAKAHEVYDVTGAGDTVIAVLGAALAACGDLLRSVTLANTAAGIVVGKIGTASVSLAELRHVLQKQYRNSDVGVLTEEQLRKEIADSRARGEKIVMTNGCFDILHYGHTAYLEKAKALGQRLVVAVNDDASVKKSKGSMRPVNALKQRMLILSALRSVDWVVPFSEDTPERLIELIKPDVLVKGGDWKVNEIVGADFVLQNGGVVESLPFVDGFSTTLLIEKIK